MPQQKRCTQLVILLLVFGVISALSAGAFAQAKKTATRAAEFDAFGGFTYVDSNYLPPYGNYGGTAGVDYTQFIPRYHGLITPSIELRGTFAQGSSVNESTVEAGFRLASTYRRLHPYGDLLVGGGSITFNHPFLQSNGMFYKRDSSFIYVYGGGLMYDLQRNFSAMADFQQQYWNLGEHPPVRFYPNALTFGVVYHIPLKPYQGRLK